MKIINTDDICHLMAQISRKHHRSNKITLERKEAQPGVAMLQNSLHSRSLDGSTGLPEEPIAGKVDKC